jgi:hypothetical protein
MSSLLTLVFDHLEKMKNTTKDQKSVAKTIEILKNKRECVLYNKANGGA